MIKNCDVNYLVYYGSVSYCSKLVLFNRCVTDRSNVRIFNNIIWLIRKKGNLNIVSIRVNKLLYAFFTGIHFLLSNSF